MTSQNSVSRSTADFSCLLFRPRPVTLVAMATSSIRSRESRRARRTKPFGLMVMLLALFSLAALYNSHGMSPNAHGAPHVASVAAEDHEEPVDSGALDQVATHAGLHGAGLPAPFAIEHAVSFAPNVWHAVVTVLGQSTDPISILRPPKG